MFKPTFKERLNNKIEEKTNWFFAPFRRKKLNNTNFTIISNNCWGAHVYEYFGLQKLSPTVGCYFFADDYIKLLENFNYNINTKLNFISLNESRHKEELQVYGGKNLKAPIGVLNNDIEIIFLHYLNKELALEKWNRRVNRINYNNLIFKFSQQNSCLDVHIERFDKLSLNGKKICFTKNPNQIECGVYYPGFENEDSLISDIYHWHDYFNLIEFLNRK